MSLWTLEPVSAISRGAAVAAYLAAIALFELLMEVGVRLRGEEHRAWWAGSGRDLLNLAGFAALAGTLRLFGFPAPAALLVGGTLTLYLFGTYVLVTTQIEVRQPRVWAFALGLCGALPVLLWPGEVVSLAGVLVASLFPRVLEGGGP
ncbi:MAG TPA: hypothetical protein VFR85_00040 [Anaeromyxobacteraceae bacterium]|nr:hypothetical protein [Anaeromyxobacteraceae bacterium]